MSNLRYDFVVVGGGTAGSVIASRLSEQPDLRVLLVEAGGADVPPQMSSPRGFLELPPSRYWTDVTPVQRATGLPTAIVRGRALGGSSAVNGLIFLRGHRSSYDAWVDQGAKGWGFDDLLEFFRRSERTVGRDPAVRGTDGPLAVGPAAEHDPLAEAFVAAAEEAGHPRARDITSGLETGFGWTDLNIADGMRQSAADAYLRPHRTRHNLDIVTDATAHRLRMAGNRCIGVDYVVDGRTVTVNAAEVVLTAGTIGTAHLLLLSGIGPAKDLRNVGVRVAHDLSGVGSNFHDHPMSTVVYEAARPLTQIPVNPFAEAVGLIHSDPTVAAPDLHVYLAALPLHPPTVAGPMVGYSIVYAAMAPRSRGSVRLAGAEPTTPPVVDPAYLGDERDVETMLAGFRIARQIGAAAAFAPWRKAEAFPGPGLGRDDDAVRGYLNQGVRTYLHPVGTCRMGVDDMSVVDPSDLRVHGLAGLRVADASVMPSIVSANTNATVYAIAERAAHLIRSE